MHYCTYLFTKELPNDEQIQKIMHPYYEYEVEDEEAVDPDSKVDIHWDSFAVGGRYCGLLKLKCFDKEDDVYRWKFYVPTPRAGRLFRCRFIEDLLCIARADRRSMPIGFYSFSSVEDSFFNYSGIRDGYVCVDGCKISDLFNSKEIMDGGYGFVDDVFDKQSTRRFWNQEECSFADNLEYENELKAAFDRNKDNYLTILDLHY